MKLTKTKLRRIIKEELQNILDEDFISDSTAEEEVEGNEEGDEAESAAATSGGSTYQIQGEQKELEEEERPLQKLATGIEKRGTEGEFSEYCGGKVTQACIDKAAKGSTTKRKRQASLAVTFSKAKGGGPSLTYPKKKKTA